MSVALATAQAVSRIEALLAERPHLISTSAIRLPGVTLQRMQDIVTAVEAAVALPAYCQRVLAEAPSIAQFDPGPRGVFLGYDFHLRDGQPYLIEINTNAGGGMINAWLAGQAGTRPVESDFLAMFREEWHQQRGDQPLRTLAIVDQQPDQQYLYPEFLLFQELFEQHGLKALIVDPTELAYHAGRLWVGDTAIDLVYNRLTDFMLEDAAHAALRAAYLAGGVVMTPHPRAHALYANKRNLVLLSHGETLRAMGLAEEYIEVLERGVPGTVEITAELGEDLWQRRRDLFFKPLAGYGSKAVYRGEKLTRGVWQSILAGGYVAQTYIPPSRRANSQGEDLKEDFRLYVYAGATQLIAARLYRGQATNFRTPSGGFARVLRED